MNTRISLVNLSGLRKTFGSNVSTVIILLFFFTLSSAPSALSQIPQGFNYQALARDETGDPIVRTELPVMITIQADSLGKEIIWKELHSRVETNDFGLINLIVGKGEKQPESTISAFADIDWSVTPKFIKTEVDYKGWKEMGVTRLWSVPYAMVADSLSTPFTKLLVEGETTSYEEPLFEVKNKDGNTVFAVYSEGVRIYVGDGEKKGPKGGFSVGGFGSQKDENNKQYLYVDDDSVRIYVNDAGKSSKGGFAIGGFGYTKEGIQKYFYASEDSVRVYIDDTGKGAKGGFAIGGYGTSKGDQKFLTVSDDSVRIYINDTGKSAKGGFAIGGYGTTKSMGKSFLNVETSATGTIDPPVNRILWYPLKNAFLAGQIYIASPDDVGENSFATGYQSKAKGLYSQSMGYLTSALGNYSTAIGKSAEANYENSFAFGDNAKALNQDAYAFGAFTEAQGPGSFAFGYVGRDSLGPTGTITKAAGHYSLAMGLGAQALDTGSFAIGSGAEASSWFSTAIGYKTVASAPFSTAIGFENTASERWSTAIGVESNATGFYSMVFGWEANSSGNTSLALNRGTNAIGSSSVAMNRSTTATGHYSTSMGVWTTAQAYASLVIGQCNVVSGNSNVWIPTDPAFVIGNGTLGGMCFPSNAFTILKNGYTAVGHATPTQMLDVNGQVRIRGGSPADGEILTSDADGNATWEPIGSHSHSATDITSGTLSVSRGGTGRSSLTANKVLVGNGTSAILYPTNLHWDNTNSRLGISDATPSYSLDINGNMRTTSTTYLATSGSNVGIGTTNPTNKLHIENGTGAARIYVNGTTGNASLEYRVSGVYVGAFGANLDESYIFMYSGGNLSLKGGKVGIGNTSPAEKLDISGGNGRVDAGYSFYTASDARYKKNITELNESLEKVLSLRGVRFDLTDDQNVIEGQGKHVGFIAQELEQIFPELVATSEDGYKSVAYDKIGPVLVEAVKEQQSMIESQQKQIDRLERLVMELMDGR